MVPARLYWQERIGVFCYKGLVWLFLGVVIGSFVAQLQGFMPMWFIAVHILSSIGLGWVFGLVYLRYIDWKSHRLAYHQAYGASKAAPARIDKIHHAGIRMMETRDLMVVTVTIFPRSDEPYQTTVRQFMTAKDLDRLEERGIVTFYEDPHDPGYGTVSTELPGGELGANVKTFKADTVYPERQKTGLLLLIGRNPNVFTRSVSIVLIVTLFGFGFLSPYRVTDNMDWFRLKITYFPQKLIFRYKGNFNPEAFKKTYDKAIEYIGDRRIESLLFYKDFTDVRVEDADKPGYVGHALIRGNSVEEGIMSLTTADPDRLFTVESVRYDLFKKALNDAAADHDIEDVMYIGIRKGIRWGTRDGRIPPDYTHDHVDIHMVFKGGKTSLNYHGETGVRLPK